MIVQNIIYPEISEEEKELFFRGNALTDKNGILHLQAGERIVFDTYMNVFDAGIWREYTGITNWKIVFEACGNGRISLYRFYEGMRTLVSFKEICDREDVSDYIFFEEKGNALYYLQIEAKDDFRLKRAIFSTEALSKREVCIGTVICTYYREKQLLQNLEKVKASLFFKEGTEYFGKLNLCVIDNASSLPEQNEKSLLICHNSNTGGSGGFSKGMEYIRQHKEYGITNVLLMDDDVDFYMESFYRMYALLALRKNEMQNRVIAGRMFRADKKYIQYTKTEIWNRSEILHTGWMQDMRKVECLPWMNLQEGEYSGWWFACFPMEFVQKEKPLPFFLHCDDVEYGLRLGTVPMALNGIQVWHETYEYRQSPVIAYYDVRNSLITNAICGCSIGRRDLWALWTQKLTDYLKQGNLEYYYATILGLYDFVMGTRRFYREDIEKHHNRLKTRISRTNRQKAWWYLKIIYVRLMVCYKKIQSAYRRENK